MGRQRIVANHVVGRPPRALFVARLCHRAKDQLLNERLKRPAAGGAHASTDRPPAGGWFGFQMSDRVMAWTEPSSYRPGRARLRAAPCGGRGARWDDGASVDSSLRRRAS